MSELTPPRIEAARSGTDPALVCRVPSGWVFLCMMQYLPGYCILQADPVVESINALTPTQRVQSLGDMALVGNAILEVTRAYRINYAIMGNSDPVLHTHIVPRYMSEPENLRKGGPWSYPQAVMDAKGFDYERDKPLITKLSQAIQRRVSMHVICGADGCKAGWVVISKDLNSGSVSCRLYSTMHEPAYSRPRPQIIALDIPIGLPEAGPRDCDLEARRLVGPGRASSVFPAPIRPVLAATSYSDACQIRLQVEGKKLSLQAWAIMPKVRDVDELLRRAPQRG